MELSAAPELVEARLLRRTSRFGAWVSVGGRDLYVHVPNSGRMRELLVPDSRLLVAPGPAGRKTAGTLMFVEHSGQWVAVDSRLPGRLFGAAVAAGALPPFAGYNGIRAEVTVGESRLDFALAGRPWSGAPLPSPGGWPPAALVEVKCCNRVEQDGTARFPDAPTERGVRHLQELVAAKARGYRAAVAFLIMRADASCLRASPSDPDFAAALATAVAAGVEAYAWRCRIAPPIIAVMDAVPVMT